MANIKPFLDAIKRAVYGEEVRGSIVSALEKVNDDNDSYQDLKKDVLEAKTAVDKQAKAVNDLVTDSGGIVAALKEGADLASTAMEKVEEATANAYTARINLDEATATANNMKAELGVATTEADETISIANVAKGNLEAVTAVAFEAKENLDSAKANADAVLLKLEDTVNAATTSGIDLGTTIDNAGQVKTELQNTMDLSQDIIIKLTEALDDAQEILEGMEAINNRIDGHDQEIQGLKEACNKKADLGDDGKVLPEQLPEMSGSGEGGLEQLNEHIADKNNPHGVTARQIEAVERYAGRIGIGLNAFADSPNTVAVGVAAVANGEGSTSVGWGAYIGYGYGATALGPDTDVEGPQSTAIGHKAQAVGEDTMQLGDNNRLAVLSCRVELSVTSDERDKADIVPITDGLAFISALTPIQYVYNHRGKYIPQETELTEGDLKKKRKYGLCEYDREAHARGDKKGQRKRVGLSAQQVQKALTGVYGTADYANIVNDNFHDMENPPEDVENQLSATYQALIPFLIQAVQELNEKVVDLERKVYGGTEK